MMIPVENGPYILIIFTIFKTKAAIFSDIYIYCVIFIYLFS